MSPYPFVGIAHASSLHALALWSGHCACVGFLLVMMAALGGGWAFVACMPVCVWTLCVWSVGAAYDVACHAGARELLRWAA